MSAYIERATVFELVEGLRSRTTFIMDEIERRNRVPEKFLPSIEELAGLRGLLQGLDATVDEVAQQVDTSELVEGLRRRIAFMTDQISKQGKVPDNFVASLANLADLRFVMDNLDWTVEQVSDCEKNS